MKGEMTNKTLNPHMDHPGQNRTRDTLVGDERSHNCATTAPTLLPQ